MNDVGAIAIVALLAMVALSEVQTRQSRSLPGEPQYPDVNVSVGDKVQIPFSVKLNGSCPFKIGSEFQVTRVDNDGFVLSQPGVVCNGPVMFGVSKKFFSKKKWEKELAEARRKREEEWKRKMDADREYMRKHIPRDPIVEALIAEEEAKKKALKKQ